MKMILCSAVLPFRFPCGRGVLQPPADQPVQVVRGVQSAVRGLCLLQQLLPALLLLRRLRGDLHRHMVRADNLNNMRKLHSAA